MAAPSDETGPWFFAWVDPNETTFVETTHARVDEWVFSCNIEHKEGDNPTATLEIENPGVGLLATGRLGWMWISKRKLDNSITPLFFGQILAAPSDLLQTVVTITLVARALDQDSRKFALAQTLKVAPYYDEVWVDLGQQNDPETVLEGYSSRWHFDRTTLGVTVSDVLEGEDGTIEFGHDDLFWDGMNLGIDNMPLVSVSVRATVNWTQKAIGTVNLQPRNIATLTGDGIIADWPKRFSSLGGGWSTGESKAIDVFNTANASATSYSINWQTRNKQPSEGDQISLSVSESYWGGGGDPAGTVPGGGNVFVVSESIASTIAYPDMFMVTGSGSGALVTTYPGNAAGISIHRSTLAVASWLVSVALELRYEAERARKEIINFSLVQDVQHLLVPPGKIKETSDQISVNGRDVGNPLYVRATLRGTGGNVSNGDQVLILSDPPYRFLATLTPGEGHVLIGATLEDSLRNLVNAINVNGLGAPGVDYALENVANETVFAALQDSTSVLLTGRSLDANIPVATTSSVLVFEGKLTFNWTGANPVQDQSVTVAGIVYTFDEGLKLGINQLTLTQTVVVQLPYHVLINPNSLEGTLINFAAAINADGGAGSQYSTGTLQNPIAQATVINGVLTVFPRHAAATLAVVGPWSLVTDHLIPDQDTVPIGEASRRSYFSIERGQTSVQALIARARAKLRITSRAVKATFVGDFETCFGLSCRKNVILNDPRFGGGQAMGKVISYYFKVNGDDGAELAGGEVGCAVGNGETLVDDPGTPTYVDAGYADLGWQMYSDQQIRLFTNDVWYTPPIDTIAQDDGLVFPLNLGQVLIVDRIVTDFTNQQASLNDAWRSTRPSSADADVDFAGLGYSVKKKSASAVSVFNNSLSRNPTVHEFALKPVDGGPYSTRYEVTTSPLMIPKQIDLAAE